jgi:hypothetical protein
MEIDVKWWSIITVIIISLIAILIIDGNTSIKNIEGCKTARIRPFPQQFFTWVGIVELNNTKQYQPSCL